ncbi:MAG: hypothetical protein HY786_04120 [Deltaproteobacteria bacterium]|nr:hypothetical protein [Deltaproteobacteria bacterium]
MTKTANHLLMLSFLFLFVSLPFRAYSNESDKEITIDVTGEGRAPIRNDAVAAARRTAIVLAKRDAVEKGFGAVVAVEMLPNKREVFSKTEGDLSFEIVDEMEKDGFYIVTISARMSIPRELIDSNPLTEEGRETYSGYKPLVEELPYGVINWQEGYLVSHGTGNWPEDEDEKKGELMARRAAVADAQAKALEMISGIRVDAENQVKGLVEKEKALYYKVNGIVRDASVIGETKTRPYKVSIKVPITGIKGVGIVFYDARRKEKKAPLSDDGETEGVYTGIIVDARGTGLKAAFFPEIVDEKGKEVYSVDKVGKDAFIKRGVAGYALAEEEAITNGRAGANPLFIKAEGFRYPVYASLGSITLPQWFVAEGKKVEERRRRQGVSPLAIKGLQSGGALKANVIISSSDAEKMASKKGFSKIFKESRVIILTDSSIGGTEGKLPSDGIFIAGFLE